MSDGQLLVVSKTPAAQSDLVQILSSAGYSIDTAVNAEAALPLIANGLDLILIDHEHADADADGYDLANHLRDPGAHRVVPVLHIAATFAGKVTNGEPSASYLNSAAEPPVLLSMVAALLNARNAERQKDEFLSTVSHELRTPLNSIIGWSDILMRRPRDTDFSQGLHAIDRNARLQAQMISDLLDVSHMASGKLEIDVAAIEPGFVIDGAIKSVADAAQARQITISRSIEAGMPLVLADSERLQQILSNLLSNAVKFSMKNGSVTLALHRDGTQARITVSDNGRGIAPELLPDLLNRFRLGGRGKSRGGGLGLGLTIAAHLATLHGGSLSAYSEGVGKGAVFSLLLPLAP
ncbi:MAG: two-component hybrid sensor and regulator [Hydrocarboniphaga sp.]|uniref:hybrid sensor histidine kinase/response regulator n=1 Tax=Hydrocarboniphaga sp. TaxID=2033016 RepID=UPI00261715E8|nr:hybrid sensor histidine kinase/response regulator [Hydrocarboniphaga sp.]MDB5969805.1 two-component hybrid sensor and regulator [Hydrocarboniphaga sp.]